MAPDQPRARPAPEASGTARPAPEAAGRARIGRGAKVLIVLMVVAVLAALAVTITLAMKLGKTSDNINRALTPIPGRPAGYRGPGYPGMLVQDGIASGPGASVDLYDEVLTAGPLTRVPTLLGPTLCTPVTIANQAKATKDVGAQAWKLQQPNGIVVTFALNGTLQGGQLAPGGNARGTVCFADNGQHGTFVLLWQSLFTVARAAWLLTA